VIVRQICAENGSEDETDDSFSSKYSKSMRRTVSSVVTGAAETGAGRPRRSDPFNRLFPI